MVGNTEGLIGSGVELFELAHKQFKIYRKKPVPSPVVFGIHPEHFDARLAPTEPAAAIPLQEPARTPLDLQRGPAAVNQIRAGVGAGKR
jgi:hypothetical protein